MPSVGVVLSRMIYELGNDRSNGGDGGDGGGDDEKKCSKGIVQLPFTSEL